MVCKTKKVNNLPILRLNNYGKVNNIFVQQGNEKKA